MKIYTEGGELAVEYKYDAWGAIVDISYSSAYEKIAKANCLLYRGYYYDFETGYYYLNSRYYDPQVKRFISADNINVIGATPDALTDKNPYAYCDDNPVMRADNGGEFWNFIIGGVVGAVVGGVVAALNGEDTAGIVIGALAGAASGVVAASGLGLIAQAGISAAISATADVANQTVDIVQSNGTFEEYDILQTTVEAGLGFATSVVGSVLGSVVGKHVTRTSVIADQAFDSYLEKTFVSGLKKQAGRSTSALIRQANKNLAKSVLYDNITRGVSSVIGSGVSLWNIAR